MRVIWLQIILIILVVSSCAHVPHNGADYFKATKGSGLYKSSNGKCSALLDISDKGGFTRMKLLHTPTESPTQIDDITGMIWANNLLVFTVSPIYGKPGIYCYDCESNEIKQIFSPRNHNNAYPDESDYFEFVGITSGSTKKILFYYAPNVDAVDFERFRATQNLYQINFDGSMFSIVNQKD